MFPFERELPPLKDKFKEKLSSIDYILTSIIKTNVIKETKKVIKTHHNSVLPFNTNDVITNLSNYKLTKDEEDVLKKGLQFTLPPAKRENDAAYLKSELFHLANAYLYNYQPRSSLKKHGILKGLKSNENIIISKPDKGNIVVILDKTICEISMKDLSIWIAICKNLRTF